MRRRFEIKYTPRFLRKMSSMVEGGSAFVTNDERLRSVKDPEIIMKDYL